MVARPSEHIPIALALETELVMELVMAGRAWQLPAAALMALGT